ncbi:MAG: cytochrome c biogenesis protein [Phycisphaerae bacterium]
MATSRLETRATPVISCRLRSLLVGLAVLSAFAVRGVRAEGAAEPAADLAAVQDQIHLKKLGAIAILDRAGWRHTTVESWSRKVMRTIYGSRPFYGLDPVAAAMELMLNPEPYQDLPIIYVKDRGILKDLTTEPIELSEEEARALLKSRHVTYRFLTSATVQARVQELASEAIKNKALNRLDNARYHYENLLALFTIIPNPDGKEDTPWSSVVSLLDQARLDQTGLNPAEANAVLAAFRAFNQAWVDRDVAAINTSIDELNRLMPTFAPAGVYPSLEMRTAETRYRRLDLLFWAWLVYIFGFFVSVFALATRYRWPRRVGLVLLIAAIGLHGYDLWLRWGVIGRVPVANMYEAVVSSTFVGALFGLVLELISRKRVYLLSSSLLGFFALSLPMVIPDKINNDLQTMMPILDDVMLRIHTVLIISSYAVITLAYGVANCYLFVSAFRDKARLAQGTLGAQLGAIVPLVLAKMDYFAGAGAAMFIGVMVAAIVAGIVLVLLLFSVFAGGGPRAVASSIRASDFPIERDLLGEFDRSHLVLLYTAAIALFVGLVLGAIWADYSWGRPWGWDPKEVFALNTWLIYAIIIHAKFVTRRRALWTSVLSVVGFAVMQFNWWVVNFYIVGLHSYA